MQTRNGDRHAVSVIMGAYNCSESLPHAIESILEQEYSQWELIIYNDGSTDDTGDVARHFAKLDNRITVTTEKSNRGLAYGLNRCLERAQGDYIARMDADDVCSPIRLATQVNFLAKNPRFDIVSTAMQHFDADGVWAVTRPNPHPIRKDLVRGTPFAHPAAMVRKVAYNNVGGYSEEAKHWRVEDYHLWAQMYAHGHAGANLMQPLYGFRNNRESALRRSPRARFNEARVTLEVAKECALGLGSVPRILRPLILAAVPVSFYEHLHRGRAKRTGQPIASADLVGYPSMTGWVSPGRESNARTAEGKE